MLKMINEKNIQGQPEAEKHSYQKDNDSDS